MSSEISESVLLPAKDNYEIGDAVLAAWKANNHYYVARIINKRQISRNNNSEHFNANSSSEHLTSSQNARRFEYQVEYIWDEWKAWLRNSDLRPTTSNAVKRVLKLKRSFELEKAANPDVTVETAKCLANAEKMERSSVSRRIPNNESGGKSERQSIRKRRLSSNSKKHVEEHEGVTDRRGAAKGGEVVTVCDDDDDIKDGEDDEVVVFDVDDGTSNRRKRGQQRVLSAASSSNIITSVVPYGVNATMEEFLCPVCPNKSFRKRNLLEQHLKFYHRKQKKTPQRHSTSSNNVVAVDDDDDNNNTKNNNEEDQDGEDDDGIADEIDETKEHPDSMNNDTINSNNNMSSKGDDAASDDEFRQKASLCAKRNQRFPLVENHGEEEEDDDVDENEDDEDYDDQEDEVDDEEEDINEDDDDYDYYDSRVSSKRQRRSSAASTATPITSALTVSVAKTSKTFPPNQKPLDNETYRSQKDEVDCVSSHNTSTVILFCPRCPPRYRGGALIPNTPQCVTVMLPPTNLSAAASQPVLAQSTIALSSLLQCRSCLWWVHRHCYETLENIPPFLHETNGADDNYKAWDCRIKREHNEQTEERKLEETEHHLEEETSWICEFCRDDSSKTSRMLRGHGTRFRQSILSYKFLSDKPTTTKTHRVWRLLNKLHRSELIGRSLKKLVDLHRAQSSSISSSSLRATLFPTHKSSINATTSSALQQQQQQKQDKKQDEQQQNAQQATPTMLRLATTTIIPSLTTTTPIKQHDEITPGEAFGASTAALLQELPDLILNESGLEIQVDSNWEKVFGLDFTPNKNTMQSSSSNGTTSLIPSSSSSPAASLALPVAVPPLPSPSPPLAPPTSASASQSIPSISPNSVAAAAAVLFPVSTNNLSIGLDAPPPQQLPALPALPTHSSLQVSSTTTSLQKHEETKKKQKERKEAAAAEALINSRDYKDRIDAQNKLKFMIESVEAAIRDTFGDADLQEFRRQHFPEMTTKDCELCSTNYMPRRVANVKREESREAPDDNVVNNVVGDDSAPICRELYQKIQNKKIAC